MSLIKFLKAPIKLFKKDVITFVIIRRYDLGILQDKLRYIAVRPSASISMLRQKVWHLLDLPDFCEEIILLKSGNDVVIPLTDLRKGNDPQHPYLLEVWLPANRFQSSTTIHNRLLTIENGDERSQHGNETATDTIYEAKHRDGIDSMRPYDCSASTISNETMALNKLRVREEKIQGGSLLTDFKKSDLTCRVSSSSLFRINGRKSPASTVFNERIALNKLRVREKKIQGSSFLTDFNKSNLTCRVSNSSLFKINGRKSRDNFTNIFFKIQSDLSTLNDKLSNLECKIQT